MHKNLAELVTLLVLFTWPPAAVSAATFTMEFQVTGFTRGSAPTDPVTGTIVWEAAGIHDPIQSFDSINLTLDGHHYSINEICFRLSSSGLGRPPDDAIIGGCINGANQLRGGTDDFWIEWNTTSLMPYSFAYASSQQSGDWFASAFSPGSFKSFSIVQVPEPSSITAFSLGLLLVAAWRMGRRSFRRCKSEP